MENKVEDYPMVQCRRVVTNLITSKGIKLLLIRCPQNSINIHVKKNKGGYYEIVCEENDFGYMYTIESENLEICGRWHAEKSKLIIDANILFYPKEQKDEWEDLLSKERLDDVIFSGNWIICRQFN